MTEEASNGRLSDAENDRIFRSEILPDYLPADLDRAENPTMIVLGGQPGSGNTAMLTASHTRLEPSGPVIRIVGDDLRSYHPGYVAYQASDPVSASGLTQRDAGIWTEKLLAAATERGIHVAFETTMRTPENVERIIRKGRDAAYRVEAHVLAVNPRTSWQGYHYRFEEVSHAGAAARMPPRAIHDAAVTGLADSLDRIERRRLVDRVVIQTAGGERIYDNRLEQGQWRFAPAGRQTLEEARGRPLSRKEIDTFARIWEHVVARMLARGVSAQRIDEVREQSRDDLAHLIAERRRADAADDDSAREIVHRTGRELIPAVAAHGGDVLSPGSDRGDREKAARSQNEAFRPAEVLIPGRNLPDLGAAEVDRKLRESVLLAEKRAEVERLSQLVYGNPAATSATVEAIDGASAGSIAGQDVRAGKLGPMAGDGRGFLRAESPERQTAKAHLPQLAAALEDYGRTVDFERHQIENRHREDQNRQRQEIRAPSQELSAVLQAPAHEQANRLSAAPQLRRELDTLTTSISRRLAPADRVALRAEDVDRLTASMAISRNQAQALSRVHAKTQAIQNRLQQQRRQVEFNRNAAITIKR